MAAGVAVVGVLRVKTGRLVVDDVGMEDVVDVEEEGSIVVLLLDVVEDEAEGGDDEVSGVFEAEIVEVEDGDEEMAELVVETLELLVTSKVFGLMLVVVGSTDILVDWEVDAEVEEVDVVAAPETARRSRTCNSIN